MLVEAALKKMTPEEVASAVAAAENLDMTKEALRTALLEAVAAGGIAAIARLLGKRVVKEVTLGLLQAFVAKQVGKKVAEQIIKAVAKKVPQYAFQAFANFIGIALIAKDLFDLGGEATRVTMPITVHIAIGRALARAQADAAPDETSPLRAAVKLRPVG